MNDFAKPTRVACSYSWYLFDRSQFFSRSICPTSHLKCNENFTFVQVMNDLYGEAIDKQESLVIEKDSNERSNFLHLFKEADR